MKRKLPLLAALAAMAALLAIFLPGALADVSTDLQTYQIGDTVYITGDGMDQGETVDVDITNPNSDLVQHHAVPADDQGSFSDTYVIPDDAVGGIYTVTATGESSGKSFSTTFDPPAPPVQQDVSWDKNGTNLDGTCKKFESDPDINPGPGQQGWLFILTSPFDSSGSQLTTSFNPSTQTPSNPITGVPKSGGSYHFIVYTDAGAKLLSATATNGTQNSNLTVSHCALPNSVPPAADLTVSKDANGSYDNTYTWTVDKKADTDTVYSAGGGESGAVNYTVTVSHDGGTVSNVKVTGTIDVTNPNGGDVLLDDVTDALSDGTTCTVDKSAGLTVPANGSESYPYECNLGALPSGDLTNTATASWSDQTLSDGSQLDANSVPFTTDPISFTANDIDSCTDVSDTLKGSLGKVCVGDDNPKEFKYALTFNDDAVGTCTDHKNTASAKGEDTGDVASSDEVTVQDCQGSDLTVKKDATPSFKRTYKWDISKKADTAKVYSAGGGESGPANYTVSVTHDTGTDSDWAVKGTITITNPNDWQDITLTSLDDALDVSGACTLDTAAPYVVPKSDSLQVGYTCATASASDAKNTATAKWDKDAAHTPTGSASGDAKVDFSTATPTIVDGSVSVSDSVQGSLGTVSYTDPSPTDFTYKLTFKDPAGTCTDHKNTATATASDSKKAIDSDTVTVTDCQGSDLTVSKTATSSFKRTYKWSITKDVDKTSVNLIGGGSATFKYTVKASHDSGTDSDWAVKGTITVTNPNDWEDITLTGLSDALNSSGACSLDTAGPYLVKKSGSLQVGYTCSSASSADTKNTATATWDKDAAHTPTGSASGDAPVAFTTPTTVADDCVTLTDTFNGGSAVKLGKACVGGGWTKDAGNNLASFTESYTSPTFTFTYTRTISAPPAGSCLSYKNTAEFTTNTSGTKGSDSETVTVCNYNAALTPGYWKNHLANSNSKGPYYSADCKNVSSSGGSCSTNGVWAIQFLPKSLGNYSVGNIIDAAKVFNAMNCGASTDQSAIGCLAGHLLATKLNLANQSIPSPCILQAVADADAFLKGQVVNGVTGVVYSGPSWSGTLTAAQRSLAIALKSKMDNYNNGTTTC